MRYILIVLAHLAVGSLTGQGFFEQTDLFFANYVNNGKVDYQRIGNEPDQLQDLVQQIAKYETFRSQGDELKAFYINAYNLLVIKQVVDLYPIGGPLEVTGFFNDTYHLVGGQRMSLDELEKEELYKEFPDPRLHFVLVCAAKGCPPLVGYAYRPGQLEQQLTERTREILNLDGFIRVTNKQVNVSEIFNWYRSDFEQNGGSVLDYINGYRKKKISKQLPVSHYEYDWTLNE